MTRFCIHTECKRHATYNLKDLKPKYCSTHKTDEMVNVNNKRCLHEDCNKRPNYNLIGLKPIYCNAHKTNEMIDVINKLCLHDGCNIRPYYNLIGLKPIYCNAHKTDEMIDIRSKRCKSEWCSTRVGSKKYDGYCLHCYMHLFPDKPVSRNYKTKEYAVVEYVTLSFPTVHWIADKIIKGGCSKRRPDLILDLFYQIIIVEVDENQHMEYDCSCENKRVMELSQDLGHRPIIFIRFNPDDYITEEAKITSCWGLNKTGICVIKKSKQSEWKHRLTVLKETIENWLNPEHVTDKTIETIHLFYDR